MRTHAVEGGNGLRLHVREWGDPRGPVILLIHGWSQSGLSWRHQCDGALAGEFRLVALDIRGHGMSEKPLAAEHYTDSELWAQDIAAVIGSLRLERPVLVGWSYGALAIADYLRSYGEDAIAGINLVAGLVRIAEAPHDNGPGFLDIAAAATSPDLATSISGMRRFVTACTAQPMTVEDRETALCFNMVVPSEVRLALISRRVDSDDVLGAMGVPVLVSHGTRDSVVLPSMSEHVLRVCPTAEASWYEGIGHMPFIEDPARFDRELAGLARRTAHAGAIPRGRPGRVAGSPTSSAPSRGR